MKEAGAWHGNKMITTAYFVSLLREANGNKRYLKLQSDAAAKAAAWDGDEAAIAVAVEDPKTGLLSGFGAVKIFSFSLPTYDR